MFVLDEAGLPNAKKPLDADVLAAAITASQGDVRVIDCEITGPINLRGVRFTHELTLRGCIFKGFVEAGNARFGDTVDLTDSTFEQNVRFSGAHFFCSLHLDRAAIRRGTTTGAETGFELIRVDGNLSADALQSDLRLNLKGLRVHGDVSLACAVLKGGLRMETGVIGGRLTADGLRVEKAGTPEDEFDGQVLLTGTHVGSEARLSGMNIAGDLNLAGADVRLDLTCKPFGDQPTHVGGWLRLTSTRFQSSANFERIVLGGTLDGEHVSVAGTLGFNLAEIGPPDAKPSDDDTAQNRGLGSVMLLMARVSGQVNFNGARISGSINLQSATVNGGVFGRPMPSPTHGVAEPIVARVGGNVHLAAGTIGGVVDFQNASIGGMASLFVAKVTGAVIFQGAKLAGDLDLTNSILEGSLIGDGLHTGPDDEKLWPKGDVLMGGCKISAFASLNAIRVGGDFILQGAEIKNGLYCQSGDPARPELQARVGGRVSLRAATITGGAHMERIQLNRGAFLDVARFAGGLDLDGATVTGDVTIDDSVVDGRLSCERITVRAAPPTGDDKTSATPGNVTLFGAKVSGQVDFSGAIIDGNLVLQSAEVRGGVYCRPSRGTQRRVAEILGKADFNEMRVSGILDVTEARLRQLILEGAVIEGTLRCRNTQSTEVDLRSCQARDALLLFDRWHDPDADGAPPKVVLRLEGFQFRELSLGEGDDEVLPAERYLAMLNLAAFEESNYLAVEMWLRNQGRNEDANKIYLATRQVRRDKRKPGWWLLRQVDAFFDWPIWLALNYKYLFVGFILSLLLSTLIFCLPGAVQARVDGSGKPRANLDDWAWYDATWLALKKNLPGSHVAVDDKFELTSRTITVGGTPLWLHYDTYGSCISTLSYFLVPLFVAGAASTWLRQKAAAE